MEIFIKNYKLEIYSKKCLTQTNLIHIILKEHTAVIRYESSNKEIATVDSKGKIKAKAKGTCYIYVYAQNGVYKKIRVTVK